MMRTVVRTAGLACLCLSLSCRPSVDQLLLAAKEGDASRVEALLDRGALVTARDKDGLTPLHVSARWGRETIARLLIDRGAQVNITDKDGMTPLHVAAKVNEEAVARLLLDRGAQINATDKDGMTPLHVAAEWGAEAVVRLLLDRGAQISALDRDGVTPLHVAAKENHEALVRLLLDRGAPVNTTDKDGMTPLHWTAKRTRRLSEAPTGHGAVARLLLDRGAPIEALTMKGATPLHVAAKEGNEEVARLLLDRRARINETTKGLVTPLLAAVKQDHVGVVQVLLDRGASITVTDQHGRSPLHEAAGEGRERMVRILLDRGAPVTARDEEGRTPLHDPVGRGHDAVVRLLLDRGANVAVADRKGWTPLHMAAFHGHDTTARLLLDRGAQVTVTDAQGLTPLHGAAFYGYDAVARVLLDHRASAGVKDSQGRTPLDYAREKKKASIIQVLAQTQSAQPTPGASASARPLDLPLIKVDGSSTVYPLTEAMADGFHAATRGAVRVTVGISGTGGGFRKFCHGETDVQDASRPITADEMTECRTNRVNYFELPVAYDAISIVVSAQNAWVETMSMEELKTMWEPAAQRRITFWNEVRREWPAAPLKLFGADADSGTFDYFTEAVVGRAKASRSDYTASENDNSLVDTIGESRFALGYIMFANLEPNRRRLKAVAIDAGQGPVLPSRETVAAGRYQPLSRPIFIYISSRAAERPAVKQFVEFYLTHAATLAEEVRCVPVSAEAYRSALQNFRQGKQGTVFGGTSAGKTRIEDMLTRDAKQ